MQVLITGAHGFVGSALVAHLRTNHKDLWKHIVLPSHRLGGDADFRNDLRDVDIVVHLAARVHLLVDSAKDPLQEYRAVNVEGTRVLAEQAADAGVKRFIFLSSVKVNGEQSNVGRPFIETDVPLPQDPYGISKWEAEQCLWDVAKKTGMEVVIIRPPLVYGPGVKANFAALMRAVQRGYPLPLGAMHNQRSLVALDNLIALIIVCTTHPFAANQTFLVSDGQDMSTTQLINEMAQAAGVTARLLPVSVPLLRAAANLLGKADAIDRLCGNLQVDISKVRQLLDWNPPVSVQEGLRRVVQRILPP